jgi:Tetratricopeptide repeat/PEGA domain
MNSRHFSFALALVVTLLAGMRPAAADSKSLARDRLEEGSALYRNGDYQGALRKFEQARGLFPSAKIYFNLGQAYSRLGSRAAAVDAFERFLDEATDADPARRADAARFVTELEPRVARVQVQVPAGSEVAVDGRPAGVAPLKRAIPVEPGSHQVTARAPGSAMAAVGRVQVDAGEIAHWQVPVAAEAGAAAPSPPAPVVPTPSPSPPPAVAPGVPAVAAGVIDTGPETGTTAARRWWPWAAGAAAVVVAGVVATVLITSGGDTPGGTFPTADWRTMEF